MVKRQRIKLDKNASVQQAVWRQSGCLFADTLVVIWKFTARRTLSEPPPERQAAGRCVQAGDSAVGKLTRHENETMKQCTMKKKNKR